MRIYVDTVTGFFGDADHIVLKEVSDEVVERLSNLDDDGVLYWAQYGEFPDEAE